MARLHLVVLAGGKGTRFWPMSTPERPKQFLRLFGDRSLLQNAVDRVAPLVGHERIWISTDAALDGLARQEVPEVPSDQFVIEPVARNTLPGIALACVSVRRKDPEAVVAVVCADHLIRREATFRDLLAAAAAQAHKEDALLTFGIRPTRPETGYGYIRFEATVGEVDGFPVYRVGAFTEKPNRELAEEFLRAGHYLWNSGMFVWRLDVFFAALETHQPRMARQIDAIAEKPDRLGTIYPDIERVSIDYGLMEKAEHLLVMPAEIGWDDVGSWESVWTVWNRDADENAVRANHLGVETRNCLIFGGEKPIVTLGIDGLIVVETENALLICPRDRAQEVRDLAERIRRET